MSLFIEVESIEKDCTVIINLDSVVEIAPLVTGGCALFFTDGAGMNSKSSMRVKNEYSEFKQFAMKTVSSEDIARKIASLRPQEDSPAPSTSQEEQPKKQKAIKIPKFGGGSVDIPE